MYRSCMYGIPSAVLRRHKLNKQCDMLLFCFVFFLNFVLSLLPHHPTMAELPQNISSFERVNEAASYIKECLPSSLQSPRVAIVCGTGLGGLVHTVGDTPRVEYDYSSIPHFPQLTGESGSS